MRISLAPVIAGIVLAAVLGVGRTYTQGLPATSQGQATPEGQTVFELTAEQLDQLLAPIALFPDDLLSDILMAATYPLEVVEAARWFQDPHNALLSGDQLLESVRKVYEGLQSLRSMRRMEASRRNASALSVRFSKSLARRRQRLSQARVRSTTHRIGSTSNPLALSDRFTISTASSGRCLATAWANCGPW